MLVNQLVQPSLFLINSSLPEETEWAIGVYIYLIRAEFMKSGKFSKVGRHTIDSMDEIVREEFKSMDSLFKSMVNDDFGTNNSKKSISEDDPPDRLSIRTNSSD